MIRSGRKLNNAAERSRKDFITIWLFVGEIELYQRPKSNRANLQRDTITQLKLKWKTIEWTIIVVLKCDAIEEDETIFG
jgi:hypothetical protein